MPKAVKVRRWIGFLTSERLTGWKGVAFSGHRGYAAWFRKIRLGIIVGATAIVGQVFCVCIFESRIFSLSASTFCSRNVCLLKEALVIYNVFTQIVPALVWHTRLPVHSQPTSYLGQPVLEPRPFFRNRAACIQTVLFSRGVCIEPRLMWVSPWPEKCPGHRFLLQAVQGGGLRAGAHVRGCDDVPGLRHRHSVWLLQGFPASHWPGEVPPCPGARGTEGRPNVQSLQLFLFQAHAHTYTHSHMLPSRNKEKSTPEVSTRFCFLLIISISFLFFCFRPDCLCCVPQHWHVAMGKTGRLREYLLKT